MPRLFSHELLWVHEAQETLSVNNAANKLHSKRQKRRGRIIGVFAFR